MPYKFNKSVYCSEMRDWSPPPLNKLGKEYKPIPYSIASGEKKSLAEK